MKKCRIKRYYRRGKFEVGKGMKVDKKKECERYDGGKWEILNDLNIYGYKLYIGKYEGKK